MDASRLRPLSNWRAWYRRRVLFIWSAVIMFALVALSSLALFQLWGTLSTRAHDLRRELFQRDLRDLIGRFDADERYVIEHNVAETINDQRYVSPLLLPRQYFVSLPRGMTPFTPRHPPRNCFVLLVSIEGSSQNEDRICPYFAENPLLGKYLFLSAVIEDDELVPLQVGDARMSADALRIRVQFGDVDSTWWLAFQVSPKEVAKDRYEVTAFREVSQYQRNRDRKVEGWAYVQPQSGGRQQIYIIARLDFKEFLQDPRNDTWPPTGWRDTKIEVQRKDASTRSAQSSWIRYQRRATVEYSISALSSQIFSSYGTLMLERDVGGLKDKWEVNPPAATRDRLVPGLLGFKVADGNLLKRASPTIEQMPLPDTTLVLTAAHPWIVVERGFWQTAFYLMVILALGVYATRYFQRQLLRPIAVWANRSERLTEARISDGIELPYGERENEIGILANAINGLIRTVREQTAKAHAEREARENAARQKQIEEVRNREQNLQVIGHEIRSPLQSLIALHPDPADADRRYIDRMMKALPHLLGGLAATDAIRSRQLTTEVLDLAHFLREVADNAHRQNIVDVNYSGPVEGVLCRVDAGAIEDALTNILTNADRERTTGTPIQISLSEADGLANIEIFNFGKPIPAENLPRIFDFGFSTSSDATTGQKGVGLYVARTYVQAMGGTVTVANQEQGVRFVVVLPVVEGKGANP